MLSHRLLLGPVLIAALVGLFAIDMRIEGSATPQFLQSLGVAEPMPGGAIVSLVIALLGAAVGVELAGLHAQRTRSMTVCLALAPLAGLSCALAGPRPDVLIIGALAALLLSVAPHWIARRTEHAIETLGLTFFAFVFLGVIPASIVFMRSDFSAWAVLGVLMTVKSSDIGAYFTGRAIGRHKLIPWLSPGKTWEGLAGGIATAALIGGGFFWALADADGLGGIDGLWIGALLALLGQFGDLIGSLLKRSSGVKNSGRVPGFGGVLDLVDSAYFAAPAALWLMRTAATPV